MSMLEKLSPRQLTLAGCLLLALSFLVWRGCEPQQNPRPCNCKPAPVKPPQKLKITAPTAPSKSPEPLEGP